ncbi:hypothetical protein [Streptomyces ficellus]|uniref:Uncharacterized protein n=1 Tax=Streptomyces ficellus TaxID=1977088 RepID=A0A6I6FNM8_9ACTN|nr:hypothetical protein [Streptomyces ficellus]QGV80869.1 hypothetical protein EIZ62_23455 [Streptomyces ficellus]
MGIRPWVVVEPPGRRGLRRITVSGETVGSAWSLREARKVLRRHGCPDDLDLDDPRYVHWRGGGSDVWPDGDGWSRRVIIAVMVAGMLGSLALHAVVGWADAFGALTFAQRLVGVMFLLAAAVQGVATPAVADYWGRRRVRLSGALVLVGALMTLATTSILLFLWIEEREFVVGVLAFLSLWLWSLWALHLLVREQVWTEVPYPRKIAAGVVVTALLTAVSLGYSVVYQPIAAPLHFVLRSEFGKPWADADSPYMHVPVTFYAKNAGGIPAYLVVDEFTVFGYSSDFSPQGRGLREWRSDEGPGGSKAEAERYVSNVEREIVASGQFQGPGSTLDVGEEFRKEKVITLPRDAEYQTLDAQLRFAVLREDRGKLDQDFSYEKYSWSKSAGRYYCPPDDCDPRLIYHGRVRYNNNLINLTRKPRYVAAFWSPEKKPDVFISSFDFEKKAESVYDIYEALDVKELEREAARYGLGWFKANSGASVKGLLKQARS